jgi:Endosomal/lysosomal potassium channel TMEM175
MIICRCEAGDHAGSSTWLEFMRLLHRFSQGDLHLARIEAFSDGVFAVAVTLLVLDLKVPVLHDHADVRELGQALLDQLPKFLSWLISFVIVCKSGSITITCSASPVMPITGSCG